MIPATAAAGAIAFAPTGLNMRDGLRIAGDRHYFTDVLIGSAVGVAGGFFVPRWTGSLPAETAVVPTGNGIALVGTF